MPINSEKSLWNNWQVAAKLCDHNFSSSIRLLEFLWLWNQSQGLETPYHHYKIVQWLEQNIRMSSSRLVLTAFRGAGKSTLVAILCAWRLLCRTDYRILVLSADEGLASRMVTQIRSIIEKHSLTSQLIPKPASSWSKYSLRVQNNSIWRDDSVVAQGITGNITGMRADLIIVDDVETPKTVISKHSEKSLRQRLSELEYIVTPKGNILLIGTPHSAKSLYNINFQHEDFDTLNYTSLSVPVVDDKGISVWPEKFSNHRIKELRKRTSEHKFYAQMMLQPHSSLNKGLHPHRIHWYDNDLEYFEANGCGVLKLNGIKLISGTCAWDPAIGKINCCDSVIACVFVDSNGKYYLHDIEYIVTKPNDSIDSATQQCQAVVRFARRNYVPYVTIENNGIGQFLPGLLRTTFRNMGGNEAVGELTVHTNKEERIISAYDTLLSAGRLFVNQNLKDSKWYQEIQDWQPKSYINIDGLDAVAHCLLLEPVRFGINYNSFDARPKWKMRSS